MDLLQMLKLTTYWDRDVSGGGGGDAAEDAAPTDDGGNFDHLEDPDDTGTDDSLQAEPEPAPTDAPPPEPPEDQVEPPLPGPESFSPPEQVGRLLDLLGGRAVAPPQTPQAAPQPQYAPPPTQAPPQGQQAATEPPLPSEHLWDTNPAEAQRLLVERQRWEASQIESRLGQRIQRHEAAQEHARKQHIAQNIMTMSSTAQRAYKEVFEKSPACRDPEVWQKVNEYMQDRLVRAATFAFQYGDLGPAQAMQDPAYYKAVLKHAIADVVGDEVLDRPPLRTRGAARATATGPAASQGLEKEYEEAMAAANKDFGKLGVNVSRDRLRRAKERVERGIWED